MASNPPSKPVRPWRVIAEQASHEFDSKKMADLLLELNQALEEQEGVGQAASSQKKKPA